MDEPWRLSNWFHLEGFVVDAISESCPIAGMSNEAKNLYGVQFRSTSSEHGNDLIKTCIRCMWLF